MTAACGSATGLRARCIRRASPVTSPSRPRSHTPPGWAGCPTERWWSPPFSRRRSTTSTSTGMLSATFDLSDVAVIDQRSRRHPRWPRVRRPLQAIASEQSGAIGLVDPHGNVRVVATELALPNGMGFLPDGSTLVRQRDQAGSRILALPRRSRRQPRRTEAFSPTSVANAIPTACASTWKAGCGSAASTPASSSASSTGGTVTHRVEIDRGWAVAPALGGADGRTLYMVSTTPRSRAS